MTGFKKVCLVRVKTKQGSFSRVLESPILKIGRSPDVEVAVPDTGISRHHLEVKIENDQIWLTDLGSSNGSYLNGNRVDANQKIQYKLGDELLLGINRVPIEFEVVEAGSKKKSLFSSSEDGEGQQLVENAKAEAARIVELASSEKNKILEAAEEERQRLVGGIQGKGDEVLAEAQKKAKQMFADVNERARNLLKSAEAERDELVKNAKLEVDTFRKATLDKIENEKKNLLQWREDNKANLQKELQLMLDEAELKAKNLAAEAELVAQQKVTEAEIRAQTLASVASEDIRRSKERYEAKAQNERARQMEDLKTLKEDARKAAELEREKILAEATTQFAIAKQDAEDRARIFSRDAEELHQRAEQEKRETEEFCTRERESAVETARKLKGEAEEQLNLAHKKLALAEEQGREIARKAQEHLSDVNSQIEQRQKASDREIQEKAVAFLKAEEARALKLAEEAKLNAEAMIFEAKKSARQIESEALSLAYDQRRKAEKESLEVQQQARKQAQGHLQQAKVLAQEKVREADDEAKLIREQGQRDSQEIIEIAKRSAAREKESMLLQIRQEVETIRISAEAEAEAKKKIALSKIEKDRNETEKLRLEAETHLQTVQRESEILVSDSRQIADRISKKAEAMAEDWLGSAKRESDGLIAQGKELKRTMILEAESQAKDRVRDAAKKAEGLHASAMAKVADETKARVDRAEAEVADLKSVKEKLAGECLRIQEQTDELETKLASLRLAVSECESHLSVLKAEIEALNQEATKNKLVHEERIEEMAKASAGVLRLRKELDDLREERETAFNDRARLLQDVATLQRDRNHLKENTEKDISTLKENLRSELENLRTQEEKSIKDKKIEELKIINAMRAEADQHLNLHREALARQVSVGIQGHILNLINRHPNHEELGQKILQAFEKPILNVIEEELFKVTLQADQNMSQDVGFNTPKLQGRMKMVGGAVAVGLSLCMMAPQSRRAVFSFFRGGTDEAVQSFSQNLEAERARRFRPAKDTQWRDSYADATLYTEGFVNLKLSADLQEIWIRKLQDYMLTKLRVPEERSIKLFSLEAALVSKLKEHADQIHPEAVAASIAKMKELEATTVKEMVGLIGGEKNFAAFQKLSRDFYYNDFQSRSPANSQVNPVGKSPVESPTK